MKIAIIGYSGSGKSTLARQLGEYYDIPVLHMDKIQFEANWIERNEEAAKMMVKKFMDDNKSWVIDGNYSKYFREKRLEGADKIIFMNFSRWLCLWQAYSRYIRYRGKTRECMAEGCNEKFDLEFLNWILKDGRTREHKKQYKETIQRYNSKIAVINNRKEKDLFLKNLGIKPIN